MYWVGQQVQLFGQPNSIFSWHLTLHILTFFLIQLRVHYRFNLFPYILDSFAPFSFHCFAKIRLFHQIHLCSVPTWEGNGNPPQHACLENPMDRGAWWAAVYGVAQSQTRLKWLSSSSSAYIHINISGEIQATVYPHPSPSGVLNAAQHLHQMCLVFSHFYCLLHSKVSLHILTLIREPSFLLCMIIYEHLTTISTMLWTECLYPPKFICWTLNPRCGGIWRWGL